eukprot:64865-Prymnesium_polylepis.2
MKGELSKSYVPNPTYHICNQRNRRNRRNQKIDKPSPKLATMTAICVDHHWHAMRTDVPSAATARVQSVFASTPHVEPEPEPEPKPEPEPEPEPKPEPKPDPDREPELWSDAANLSGFKGVTRGSMHGKKHFQARFHHKHLG